MLPALYFGSLDSSRNSCPADTHAAAKLLERPWIEAVQEGRPRPFWSVMVPIYSCPPHHLRETLESVACYRLHAGADTNRVTRAGENAADERRSIDPPCAGFPSDQAEIVRRAAGGTAERGITLALGGLCA